MRKLVFKAFVELPSVFEHGLSYWESPNFNTITQILTKTYGKVEMNRHNKIHRVCQDRILEELLRVLHLNPICKLHSFTSRYEGEA